MVFETFRIKGILFISFVNTFFWETPDWKYLARRGFWDIRYTA